MRRSILALTLVAVVGCGADATGRALPTDEATYLDYLRDWDATQDQPTMVDLRDDAALIEWAEQVCQILADPMQGRAVLEYGEENNDPIWFGMNVMNDAAHAAYCPEEDWR